MMAQYIAWLDSGKDDKIYWVISLLLQWSTNVELQVLGEWINIHVEAQHVNIKIHKYHHISYSVLS